MDEPRYMSALPCVAPDGAACLLLYGEDSGGICMLFQGDPEEAARIRARLSPVLSEDRRGERGYLVVADTPRGLIYDEEERCLLEEWAVERQEDLSLENRLAREGLWWVTYMNSKAGPFSRDLANKYASQGTLRFVTQDASRSFIYDPSFL